MPIPLMYVVRNLGARKVTTALTAGGMALVVYVFATVLMLEEGLRKTLVDPETLKRFTPQQIADADKQLSGILEDFRKAKDALRV